MRFGLVKLIKSKSGSMDIIWALEDLASLAVVGFECFDSRLEPIAHFHLQLKAWQ